jgi:hypothetical protein
MYLNFGLCLVILFILSCSNSPETSLINKKIDPIDQFEVPTEIQSSDISKLSNSIASYQKNTLTVDVWSYSLDKKYVLGGEGRGPGELGRISKVTPFGEETLILDTVNKSILRFGSSGEFIDNIYYDGMMMSLAVDQQMNIYHGLVNFDRISVNRSTFHSFSNGETIFSMPIRDLSQSAFDLIVQDGHLLINRYLTNQTIKINLKSRDIQILSNTYIPEEAEFKQSGPYKLPLGPVWRTNAIIDSTLFQLRNIPDSKSEIYRSDLNGNINALFTFNHYTTSFFEYGDEVWMFSPDSLYKYSKSSFLN